MFFNFFSQWKGRCLSKKKIMLREVSHSCRTKREQPQLVWWHVHIEERLKRTDCFELLWLLHAVHHGTTTLRCVSFSPPPGIFVAYPKASRSGAFGANSGHLVSLHKSGGYWAYQGHSWCSSDSKGRCHWHQKKIERSHSFRDVLSRKQSSFSLFGSYQERFFSSPLVASCSEKIVATSTARTVLPAALANLSPATFLLTSVLTGAAPAIFAIAVVVVVWVHSPYCWSHLRRRSHPQFRLCWRRRAPCSLLGHTRKSRWK